ncbi:thiamine pyrophosphate-dependent enzyme [Paraburkholderia flagellata]|uniref:thiamine pyrophosphate-dependent enzyme n=1 Tax=Paraburkholderia flagellata TaxID=2883241 RepID=UPI001F32F7FE|nr:thiamine pyrophosphate-dependent enzyme [Paraburkholderia flagellata]
MSDVSEERSLNSHAETDGLMVESSAVSIMTGGEALIAGLVDHGVDTIFGLPGAQTYGLFDAIHRAGPGFKLIGARHEQACGYMAYGYARSTGRPSVFSVVPGPGLLNASAAMLTAYSGNEPVLLLTGQVPTQFLDRGRGHLHEMPNQLATLRTLTKFAERVETPSTARRQVGQAFQAMLSDRRGPAALEMPWDAFTSRCAVANSNETATFAPPAVDDDQIDRAAKLISGSRRPMIFVGSGAIEAADAIRQLAEMIDAPVVSFRSGRGVVGSDHPLGLTLPGAFDLWDRIDLAIGIGTRMEVPGWRWGYRPPGQKMLRIDIDPAEMRRTVPDVSVIADARPAVEALIGAVGRSGFVGTRGRRQEIRDRAIGAMRKVERELQPQIAYLRVLREVLPRDGIVTDELCQVGYAAWIAFPVYEPRTFISSGYQGNLGSGFPTALGVKAAHPDRPVVAITGDGGFMFAVQELATAVQYRLGVVTIVFNNNAFGNVLRDQIQQFEGRDIGSRLVNPDFLTLAEAFGVKAERVTNPIAFKGALERALADGGPRLIEVRIENEESPWRFIHPRKI